MVGEVNNEFTGIVINPLVNPSELTTCIDLDYCPNNIEVRYNHKILKADKGAVFRALLQLIEGFHGFSVETECDEFGAPYE